LNPSPLAPRLRAFGAGGLLMALCACGPATENGSVGEGAGAPSPLAFDPARLSASTRLEGVPLALEARLWVERVAAPGAPSGPLYVSVRIAPEAGAELPGGLTADRVWVIGGDHTWETGFDRLRLAGGGLEGLAGGGPGLDPALPADVVVRLRGPDDAVRFVRVRLPGVPAVH
jgi:hypothetical protein